MRIFNGFPPDRVEKVFICYDNDAAGRKANQETLKQARQYFRKSTKITVVPFTPGYTTGADLSDLLDADPSLLTKWCESGQLVLYF